MKTNLFYTLLMTILCGGIFAGAPQAINYQAVARDISGNSLANRNISIRIHIEQGINPGIPEYTETHEATTNQFGLFTLKIGNGKSVFGNFSNISWSTGNTYMLVEFDPDGGTHYSNMGSTQMMSVPYALYADSSGKGGNGGIAGPIGATGLQGKTGLAGAVGPSGSGLIVTSTSELVMPLTSSARSYQGGSITINAPRAGTILVEANVWMKLDHNNGTDDILTLWIGASLTDPGDVFNNVHFTIPAALPTFPLVDQTFILHKTFTVLSAGTYTYYLNGSMPSGASGNDTFLTDAMHAIFY